MLNKVILIGRLANDPELKYTPSGIPVTTFRLAVDRPMSAEARQSGQEKQADFIDIVAWRQSAEFASNYLGKGRLVAIDGRLQIRQYVAQDGTNRRVAEVVVEQLKSLERPRDAQGSADGEHHANGYRGHDSDAGSRHAGPDESVGSSRRPAPARSAAASAATGASETSAETDPFADGLDDPFADE
jgi:single-strand DNA-binding protein